MLTQVLTFDGLLAMPASGVQISTVWHSTKERRGHYSDAASSSDLWIRQAKQLKQAAERSDWLTLIGPNPFREYLEFSYIVMHCGDGEMNCQRSGDNFNAPVFWMLMGMAIESLIKCTLITEGTSPIEKSGSGVLRLSKELRSHEVLRLARKIKSPSFSISSYDEVLLARIERYVTWMARYPVPLNDSEYSPEVNDDRGGLRDLYERLLRLVSPR
jgi:hypothetical protein